MKYWRLLAPLIGLVAILNVTTAPGSEVIAQATTSPQIDGEKLFATNCASCHQLTGLGLEEKYPPLAASEWAMGAQGRLIRIILNGVTGPIEVAGETFDGLMPGLGPTLKDEEIAAVASYVRRSWGNKAPPVATDSVSRLRTAFSSRKEPWTAKELLAVPRQ